MYASKVKGVHFNSEFDVNAVYLKTGRESESMRNALDFIQSYKEMFFRYLYHCNPEHFPRVCDFASDVLGSYLTVHFSHQNIDVIEGLYDGWHHCWIEVDGSIVDFTVIQFLSKKHGIYDGNKSDQEFFDQYFKVHLNSPIIPEVLRHNYKAEDYVLLSYQQLALECERFEDYLEIIEEKYL